MFTIIINMFVYIYGFRLWRNAAFVVDFSGMLHLNSFFCSVFFSLLHSLFLKVVLSSREKNLTSY